MRLEQAHLKRRLGYPRRRRPEAPWHGWNEARAAVVRGIALEEDGRHPRTHARVDRVLDQLETDSLPLPRRQHRERAQHVHEHDSRGRVDPAAGEQDVTDHLTVRVGDVLRGDRTGPSELVDERQDDVRVRPERRGHDRSNIARIAGRRGADVDSVHAGSQAARASRSRYGERKKVVRITLLTLLLIACRGWRRRLRGWCYDRRQILNDSMV